MSKDDARMARVNALSDQTWAGLKTHYEDIIRIANGGLVVEDGLDLSIVMMVFHVVAGELHLREAKILDIE